MPVAPFAGAWIEIREDLTTVAIWLVAPFAGAWIEISYATLTTLGAKSHPSRVRGLK